MRATCECHWIDYPGNPTPDTNAPAGIALARVTQGGNVRYIGGFPICAAHAARMTRPHYSWPGTDREVLTVWTVEPFAP